MRHGRTDLDAEIPRTRFAPEGGEDRAAYMARVAAATAFAYAMPADQFEKQADFRYEVESVLLPAGPIARGRVHGRVQLVRDAALVEQTGVHVLFVYLIVSGSAVLRSRRSARTFVPGDIFVHDLTEPAEIVLDGYELLLLVLGRGALPIAVRERRLHGAVVPRDHPLAAIVAGLISGVHEGAARLRPAHASAAFDAALALLGAALADVTRVGSAPLPVNAAAEAIIDVELADRALTPALIAERLGVSRATLYRAFLHYGGVRKVIADRRLHRAWTLCAAHPAPPPADVARACGYASVAELNRALRAAFGVNAHELADVPSERIASLEAGATAVLANDWLRTVRRNDERG